MVISFGDLTITSCFSCGLKPARSARSLNAATASESFDFGLRMTLAMRDIPGPTTNSNIRRRAASLTCGADPP